MSSDHTLPPILIADDPDRRRTFIVLAEEHGVLIAEVFDDDDAPVGGLTVVLPRGNGILANFHVWGVNSVNLNSTSACLELAERAALAMEEDEFRCDRFLENQEGENQQ